MRNHQLSISIFISISLYSSIYMSVCLSVFIYAYISSYMANAYILYINMHTNTHTHTQQQRQHVCEWHFYPVLLLSLSFPSPRLRESFLEKGKRLFILPLNSIKNLIYEAGKPYFFYKSDIMTALKPLFSKGKNLQLPRFCMLVQCFQIETEVKV